MFSKYPRAGDYNSLQIYMDMKQIFRSLLMVLLSLLVAQYGLAQRDFYIKKNDGSVVKPNKERRVALVIGNNSYSYASSLKNPINDASDIKQVLEQLGFEVLYWYNGNRRQMISQIQTFRSKIGGVNTVALFYYAGHGIQANDDNWLVPVDANPQTQADIDVSCVGLNYLMRNLESVNSGTNIVILDACRSNPFKYSGRSSTGGLAQPSSTPKGSFIAFSTSPNTVAQDGYGRNSPYTAKLKEALLIPNIPIETTFKRVRNAMQGQTSWENSSLVGEFYFNPMGSGGSGVKDSDGDGLTDNVDQCPYEKGAISNNGCPAPSDPFANQMVSIPSGSFQMGQPDPNIGCDGCSQDENPIHSVYISSFKMSKYEVTQRQWRDIMGSNPSYFKGCDNCPVEQVSWNDIQVFLRKLNAQTSKNYRLPTEAEWEYAARGGQSYKYAGSNNLGSVGWYDENSYDLGKEHEDYGTNPVGQKSPNGYGLYDMSGNVWEWCSDWYDSGYYKNSPSNNPKGPSSGPYRVLRGGSWSNSPFICRVANLLNFTPANRDFIFGFRIVVP